MKYHYEQPKVVVPIYGKRVELEHPVYRFGTLYFEYGRGIIVIQKRFDPATKTCIWDSVDPGLANDIYLAERFHEFFMEHAMKENYPVFQLRKLMWELRMKPLPKEEWELYF